MSFEWAMVVAVLCMMVVFAVTYRNATLDKLATEVGEDTLLEEHAVRVRVGNGRVTIFRGCVVRLTDRRLIIAQKALFGRSAVLRYVLRYRDASSETEEAGFAATMKRGFIAGPVDPRSIRFEPVEHGKTLVRIPPGPGTMGHELTFPSARAGDLQRTLET